ncbi:CopG family transcriptional regulator (plasmid) [Haloarcula sp. NS06]|uniref:ribbon-helix-helix domain-containing protein n=1 Tax=Haloarcula sp. NS06 TaxID=3409688 RepID=UPI003DA72E31
MQRFSISVDDELAAWIEAEADERGVSKAKVIRDSVETARITGLVHADEHDVLDGGDLLDRIERLEGRVAALEENTVDGGHDDDDSETDALAAFEAQLEVQPPTTEHGEQAVLRVFSLLVEDGPMKTSELREALYPKFEDEFSSAESMWQSINRYFSDLDGIEKAGHGKWDADLTEL